MSQFAQPGIPIAQPMLKEQIPSAMRDPNSFDSKVM